MNFIFECSTRYLTSERIYLYKHTNNDVFDDFPKISEDFPKLFRRLDERFRTFSENFPKVDEDFRGGTDDVLIIQQHI